jgi:hypothetical protein
LFVQAEIPTPPLVNITRLPATALRSDNSLLVVDADGHLQRKVVVVAARGEQWAWVSGLSAGERVVKVQTGVLVAGMAVDVAGDGDLTGAN